MLLDSSTNSEQDDEGGGGGAAELDEGCGGGGGSVLELDELGERLELVLLVLTLLGCGGAPLELDVGLACDELLGKGGGPELD